MGRTRKFVSIGKQIVLFGVGMVFFYSDACCSKNAALRNVPMSWHLSHILGGSGLLSGPVFMYVIVYLILIKAEFLNIHILVIDR